MAGRRAVPAVWSVVSFVEECSRVVFGVLSVLTAFWFVFTVFRCSSQRLYSPDATPVGPSQSAQGVSVGGSAFRETSLRMDSSRGLIRCNKISYTFYLVPKKVLYIPCTE